MTVDEMRDAVGKDSEQLRKEMHDSHDELNKKMDAFRRKLMADETRNKLEYSFKEDEFQPAGNPVDHTLVKDHATYITHMVPVDHVRPLIPTRFTLNSIIHDMKEWALITVKHEKCSVYPYRAAFGKKAEVDTVTYYSYVVDRSTGERASYVFSFYTTPNRYVKWMRHWWSFPLHQFSGFESNVEFDEGTNKFTSYSITGVGGSGARAGAVRAVVEDTGYNVMNVKGFAGFRDAESAVAMITSTHVKVYQQLDYVLGRSDSWHEPLTKSGTLTIGKLASSSEEANYSGVTTDEEGGFNPIPAPPEGVYPWIQFWDLIKLNRDRHLHSVLLYRGRQEEVCYMPFHVYDEQIDNPLAVNKIRRAMRYFSTRLFNNKPRKSTKLSKEDYEDLWKRGKFT